MKNRYIKYLCLGTALISQSVFSAITPFEDFSGAISLDRFYGQEKSIQLDTINQNLKVSSKAKSYTKNGRSNILVLVDSNVTMLQADLSVTEVMLGDSGTQHAAVRLAGTFYNSKSASPVTDLGEVFVTIALGDRGNGPEAWYEIQESTAEKWDVNAINVTQGSLGVIELGTPYTASISYDGNQTFSIVFNNGAAISVQGPARVGPPKNNAKFIGTRIRFGQNNSTPDNMNDGGKVDGSAASVSGTFDNVMADGGLLDDFSSVSLNRAIWNKDEHSKLITAEGKYKMWVTGQGSKEIQRLSIRKLGVNMISAKVTLSSSSTQNATTRTQARISLFFGNDTYNVQNGDTPNGYEGELWGMIAVERKQGFLRAFAYAERPRDADWTSSDQIMFKNLGTINYDQEYTLSIERTGTQVTFKKDNVSVATIDLKDTTGGVLSGQVYQPASEYPLAQLATSVRDGAGEAYALFDDIMTDYVPETVSLNAKNGSGAEIAYPATAIVHEGEVVTLSAAVNDPSTVIAYLWEQTAGAGVAAKGTTANKIVGTDNTFSFTVPAGSDTQKLAFKVTVVNDTGLETVQNFDMSVDNSAASTISGAAAITESSASTTGETDTKSSSGGGSVNLGMLFLLLWLFYFSFARKFILKSCAD